MNRRRSIVWISPSFFPPRSRTSMSGSPGRPVLSPLIQPAPSVRVVGREARARRAAGWPCGTLRPRRAGRSRGAPLGPALGARALDAPRLWARDDARRRQALEPQHDVLGIGVRDAHRLARV